MIQIDNLVFRYAGGTPIFQGFCWSVADGDSWAVIGPSGCGKSSLLYLLAALRIPDQGEILIRNTPVMRPRPETGLILQDHGLLPWATIRQNVELGLRIRQFYGPDGTHSPRDYDPVEARERVDQWLERLGIADQAGKFPSQVSGGQRQRAAIARTLVLDPDLLLMDEPFSSLDAPTREGLQDLIVELQQETGLTVVVVTHSIEEAVFLGRKILVLQQPPTRTARILENPEVAGEHERSFRNSAMYLERTAQLRNLMGLSQ